MDEGGAPYFSYEKFCMATNCYNNKHTSVVPMAQEFCMETHGNYNNPTSMVPMTQESYIEAPYYYTSPTTMVPTAQKYMGTTYYNNNHTAMAQGSYLETPYYNNNDTAMAQGSYMETPYYNNNDTAMAQGSYMETPYYNNNDTAMAQGSYMETPYYNNNDTAMAQGSYMETPYYNNNDTAMAQGSYMETPYYNNNDTAMAQGSFLETPYYNNDTTMAQGSYLETPYNNNDTAMAQGSCLETPYYSNNTSTTMVPMAQDYYMYMGTTYYNNNNTSTTVVPLTQEWVSWLQTNMNDGYGPSMIMEKFLTSLPECESETPAYQDGSVQECNPEVGENEASESCNKSKHMTRSEMTEPEAAPPGDIGQDCSGDFVKSPPCLTPDSNHTGDVEGPIGMQDADLLNHLDDWIILFDCEAGSVYYSDDEDMSEEMTGPDGGSMEERKALTTSRVPGRLVDKLSDYTTEKIQLLDHFELDHRSVSGLEDLEDIQFLDQIELNHQSLGTEDLEVIQLLDFIEIINQKMQRRNSNSWILLRCQGCVCGREASPSTKL
ncbi:Hypp3692 [Branchiostoma lanceolatum]|uniref:Hypp3692 protein n=1 Tax=Branchiostoma lanceolatum TaxID=7740 RepID=A0A8K0ESI8_BRALA|nr:Hypp3692 [Branchiostoma lanceolatum]